MGVCMLLSRALLTLYLDGSFVCVCACVYVSYGIGYSTEDRGCGFHVMSYGLDTAGLCDNLGKALQEMKEVMVAYAPAPKPAKQ